MKKRGATSAVLWASASAILLAVGACGPNEQAAGPAGVAKAKSGNATAEQVARDMRGKVRCPAKVATARAPGPAIDVVGVWPGMTFNEAANVVLCDNPLLVVTEAKDRGFNIETFGVPVRQGFIGMFAEPRVAKTSEQIVKDLQDDAMRRGLNTYVAPLKPGQSRYFVSTMGMPGQERVIAVAREEYYPEGKLPSIDSLKQALIAKYGAPSQVEDNGTHSYLWWEADAAGRPTRQGSPLYAQCRMTVSPDAPINLKPECGAQVGALIQGAEQNPGLAHSLAVTSQNGAQGYAMVTQTENALKVRDEARRAREVQAATNGAVAPKL